MYQSLSSLTGLDTGGAHPVWGRSNAQRIPGSQRLSRKAISSKGAVDSDLAHAFPAFGRPSRWRRGVTPLEDGSPLQPSEQIPVWLEHKAGTALLIRFHTRSGPRPRVTSSPQQELCLWTDDQSQNQNQQRPGIVATTEPLILYESPLRWLSWHWVWRRYLQQNGLLREDMRQMPELESACTVGKLPDHL